MEMVEAWNIINCHTYFVKYQKEYKTFYNDFKNAVTIYPLKNDKTGITSWLCEYGSLHLESGLFYHDYKLDIIEDSYEACIMKLAHWLVDTFGEDDIDDYYIVEIDDSMELLTKCVDSDNYEINKNHKSYWDTEVLLTKILMYEELGNKGE